MKILRKNYTQVVNELNTIVEKSEALIPAEIASLGGLIFKAYQNILPYDFQKAQALRTEADKLSNFQNYGRSEHLRLFDEGLIVLALNVGAFIEDLEISD